MYLGSKWRSEFLSRVHMSSWRSVGSRLGSPTAFACLLRFSIAASYFDAHGVVEGSVISLDQVCSEVVAKDLEPMLSVMSNLIGAAVEVMTGERLPWPGVSPLLMLMWIYFGPRRCLRCAKAEVPWKCLEDPRGWTCWCMMATGTSASYMTSMGGAPAIPTRWCWFGSRCGVIRSSLEYFIYKKWNCFNGLINNFWNFIILI